MVALSEFELICILCVFGLVLSDLIIVTDLRIILNDFLVGNRNRKSARKIYEQQNLKNKITMSYVREHIDTCLKDFEKYHRLYMLEFISIGMQCIGLILLVVLGGDEKIKAVALFAYIILKFVFHRVYSCKPFRGRTKGSRTIYGPKKRKKEESIWKSDKKKR